MGATLVVHIVAGSLGLISGFVALYAAKGAALHRRAGMIFFAVMLTMTATGTVIAAARGAAPAMNIPAALITGYLVVTGLTTVRPPRRAARWVALGAMIVAAAVGLVSLRFGVEAIAGGGKRNGLPAFPFLLFGVIGVLASIGDLRMLRAGGVRGVPRLRRHLWRMCFALFIASMSFFLGQADEIPERLRIPALLAVPVLAVPATMLYWLWRLRPRRPTGNASVRMTEAV